MPPEAEERVKSFLSEMLKRKCKISGRCNASSQVSIVLDNVDHFIAYAEVMFTFSSASLKYHYFGFLRIYSKHP